MAKNKKTTVEPIEVSNNTAADAPAMNTELTEEQLAEARVELRANMKEKFDKWMEILDEDATQEDIDSAREEFEKKMDEWKHKTFVIAPADKALDTCKLLQRWNAELNMWDKGAWRGVILFDELIAREIETQTEKATDLIVDYQTLIFLNHSMGNPRGQGLKDALKMKELEAYDMETNAPAADRVTYSSVLSEIFKQVNQLSLADKMLNLWRERITLAAAGIKTNFKITELEEFKELHDAWVVTDTDVN